MRNETASPGHVLTALDANGLAHWAAPGSVSGGNTLDEAYDQGGAGVDRKITADAGPVNIDGPDGLIITSGDLTVAVGNINLDASSATAGNILNGGALFIHNFGAENTFIGRNAGNLTMTGYNNTASGADALGSNTIGNSNTASGVNALGNNTTGSGNTASGGVALQNNTTGSYNTAIGNGADVFTGDLINATAIGANAKVDASNKIKLGNANVTVIEGQVAYTFKSDSTKKENFRPVDGDEVLRKIRGLNIRSWNYIGNDPQKFRHYGPMSQEFFAAFGHDDVGTCGTPTTINSGDMTGILMIAVQALEKEKEQMKAENKWLKAKLAELASTVERVLANQEKAKSNDNKELASNR